MKKLIIFLLGFIGLSLTILPLANSDPLNEVPAWYCTISGNAGAFKIFFHADGTLSGIGAMTTGGVVSLKGTYAFEPSSNKFSGNIQFTGNFLDEDSSFEGKISKGKSISFQIIQSDGEKYKVTGSTSAANKMVNGFFDCSIKGFDKGSFVLESSDSETEDIFLLEGIGATQQLGSVLLEIIGYGDSKGNLYGQWYAEGSLNSAEGTFKGKYKSGKITITGTDVQGNSFTIKSAARDMTLKVPFEENRGSTCLSSSMAMVLEYYKTGATFDQVFGIFGLPPTFDPPKWIQFENWIETFGLTLITYDKATIEDVLKCVYDGFPVVVLQYHHSGGGGHDRVIIGYNLSRRELILNDPSNYGQGYRMSFDEFDGLWNFDGYGSTRLLYLIIPKTSENPLSDLSPYVWY